MRKLFVVAMMICLASTAWGATFVNGDFETGDATGWTTGGGYRASILNNNSNFVPATFLPGGSLYNSSLNHSAVVGPGIAQDTDGNLNEVYAGKYSYRAEDLTWGGYASAITQTVTNYTNTNIYFAWAAVLEGAHGINDSANFKLVLRDDTAGVNLVTRQYNAASSGGGIDSRFTKSTTNHFYTAWQIESLDVSSALGHNFTLSLLASDCQPTGHSGRVYLDGFGIAPPPPGVPEPGTMMLLGSGLVGLAAWRRKK